MATALGSPTPTLLTVGARCSIWSTGFTAQGQYIFALSLFLYSLIFFCSSFNAGSKLNFGYGMNSNSNSGWALPPSAYNRQSSSVPLPLSQCLVRFLLASLCWIFGVWSGYQWDCVTEHSLYPTHEAFIPDQ